MSDKILGLELSLDRLSAVIIKSSLKKRTLVDASWTARPSNDPDGSGEAAQSADFGYGWEWDAESFENALAILLSKIDLKGCSTSAICLPASLISFRTLKMPFTSGNKIRQILPFELTSHLPMNHSGYISDFLPVNNISKGNSIDELSVSEDKHIFTASLPVDVMDICFPVLKKHGIEPELVASQGLVAAVCRWQEKIAHTGFEKKIDDFNVFIETTQWDTVISFMYRENIVAVRSFAGKKDPAFIEKAINQTISGLRQRYESGYDTGINHLYPVDISDLLDISSSVKMPGGDVSWFNAVAVALCCVNRKNTINFCQGEYAKNSFFHKFKDNLVVLSIFVGITFAALFINIEYDIFKLHKQVSTFDKAITEIFTKTFPDVKVVVEPLMQMQVKIKEAEAQIASGSVKTGSSGHGNIRAVEILYELSSRIPDGVDVEVTRFLLSEGKVVMAGSTDNFNTVDRIKTMIEKYNRFKSVTISSATADKTGNRISFNFIIELN